jgi:hypothetical protein
MLLKDAKVIVLGNAVSAISVICVVAGSTLHQKRKFISNSGFNTVEQKKIRNLQLSLQDTNELIKLDLKTLNEHSNPSNKSLSLLHHDLNVQVIEILFYTRNPTNNLYKATGIVDRGIINKMNNLQFKLDCYAKMI